MFQSKVREQQGSAILEFIIFVMVGQMLVFGVSTELAALFTSKVELQILASNAARSIAQKLEPEVPAGVTLVQVVCSTHLVCVTLHSGTTRVSAVSYQ